MAGVTQQVLLAMGSTARVSFLTDAFDGTDLTTYSFASISLGDDTATRVIVVGAGTVDTGANSIASGTIGGVATTVIANADSGGGVGAVAGMMYAVIPTGTGSTGTIAVTMTAAAFRLKIGVWVIYNYAASAPYANNTSVVDPNSATRTPTANSVCIGVSTTYTEAGATYTWTNLTENYDADGEGINENYSGACAQGLAAASTTFTGDPSAATTTAGVFAFWA